MSDVQRLIAVADLAFINSALSSINSEISEVNSELGTLTFKHKKVEVELANLASSFAEFVAADIRHKTLHLAETRQGNLKQDLQIKFGYYAEVRRMATGILQAVDIGIIGDSTLKSTTEEIMIKAPGYWLAPVLVALAAWIRNDKSVTDSAINEALKRDDYKTTLFFMLLMRRLNRNEASIKWVERYFMHQNPNHLDREFILILEAVTTGVFPPAARQLMMRNVKEWLDQLTQGDNYIDKQKVQWVKFFEAKKPLSAGEFPLLQKFSTNFASLELSLKEAKTHDILNKHFKDIIAASVNFSKDMKVQLDEILSLLVTNFDDEELPLQEQVRLNHLIIEKEGDKEAAQAVIDAEKHIFDEHVDFLQLLTNASFNPELSGATKVTQALAVSISQPWILDAHQTFTAQCRKKVPPVVNLDIDDFQTSTINGSDEIDLLNKQASYYSDILDKELNKISFPIFSVLLGVCICLLGFWAFELHSLAGLAGLGIGVILIWHALDNRNKIIKAIKDNIAERKNKAKEVLKGCIAETVDYRKEYTIEDAKAEQVKVLLKSILPEDFSSMSRETVRNII